MKTAHTPGPWVYIADAACVFQKSSKRIVCDVYRVGSDGNKAHKARTGKDALLIAAAPDLLAALIAISKELPYSSPMNAHIIAREAIAKATGEANEKVEVSTP